MEHAADLTLRDLHERKNEIAVEEEVIDHLDQARDATDLDERIKFVLVNRFDRSDSRVAVYVDSTLRYVAEWSDEEQGVVVPPGGRDHAPGPLDESAGQRLCTCGGVWSDRGCDLVTS